MKQFTSATLLTTFGCTALAARWATRQCPKVDGNCRIVPNDIGDVPVATAYPGYRQISSDELLTPDPVWEECKDFVFGQQADCINNEVYPCALSCENHLTDDFYCQFQFITPGASGPALQLATIYDAGTTTVNTPDVIRDLDPAAAACCPFIIITNDTGTEAVVDSSVAYQATTCTVGNDADTCF